MNIKCNCSDPCFGRGKAHGNCTILNESYPKGKECKFCKPRAEYTNGIYYPDRDKHVRRIRV